MLRSDAAHGRACNVGPVADIDPTVLDRLLESWVKDPSLADCQKFDLGLYNHVERNQAVRGAGVVENLALLLALFDASPELSCIIIHDGTARSNLP